MISIFLLNAHGFVKMSASEMYCLYVTDKVMIIYDSYQNKLSVRLDTPSGDGTLQLDYNRVKIDEHSFHFEVTYLKEFFENF